MGRALGIGLSIVIALALILGLGACSGPQPVTHASALYAVQSGATPASLAAQVPHPPRNPFSAEGIALGKRLFYDANLSANGQVSCASCHQQALAFTDGTALSQAGASGQPLLRHAPALINLAWQEGLFWDGGAKDIESLAFAPLMHPDEMAADVPKMLNYLQQDATYRSAFKAAFGTDSIVSAYVVRALAQFQRTLISNNSRYDRIVRNTQQQGQPIEQFTQQEAEGMLLFNTHCASCHTPPFFTDHGYHNNGLNSSEAFANTAHDGIYQGRYRISNDKADLGKFKTPTLRNVALTGPYMHDGRFETLWEVIHHYTEDVQQAPTLDSTLVQPNGTTGVPLTFTQQEAIIAFLETLTDSAFINNPAFRN